MGHDLFFKDKIILFISKILDRLKKNEFCIERFGKWSVGIEFIEWLDCKKYSILCPTVKKCSLKMRTISELFYK